MSIYRKVSTEFWADRKVLDTFTPEDKYFYMWCLTNPATTLCGCFELVKRRASVETGYSSETIERLIKRLEDVHGVIAFSRKTNELLILNWSRYNWSDSPRVDDPLLQSIYQVKDSGFRDWLGSLYNRRESITKRYFSESEDGGTVAGLPSIDAVARSSKSLARRASADAFADFAGQDAEMAKALHDFSEMRERIRHPLTLRAKELIIKKLVSLSSDRGTQIAILEQSIERSWQGVFPLKEDKPSPQNGQRRKSFSELAKNGGDVR